MPDLVQLASTDEQREQLECVKKILDDIQQQEDIAKADLQKELKKMQEQQILSTEQKVSVVV